MPTKNRNNKRNVHTLKRASLTPRINRRRALLAAFVAVGLVTGTYALPISGAIAQSNSSSGNSGTTTNTTTTATCTVDPKHTKLKDQMGDKIKPWKRSGNKQVVVYFAYAKANAQYKANMEHAAKVWSTSPCVDLKVVTKCPSKSNCITVQLKKSNNKNIDGTFFDEEKGGFLSGGRIEFYTQIMGKYKLEESRRSVVVHEMGHALGLAHRKSRKSVMNGTKNDEIVVPHSSDFLNLRVIYGKQK